MSTSNTYLFGAPKSLDIIDEAYERIGVKKSFVVDTLITSAQRSLNFILQEWTNKGNNLWTIEQGLVGLNPGQSAYQLPSNLSDIKTAVIRTSTRNLGGTAASSAGGTASDAFNGSNTTACTQTSANGEISYDWGSANYLISMVGIKSNITEYYTITCEYSYDNVNWNEALSITTREYKPNNIEWFAIPVPVVARAFRIKETGGATLDIQQLFFNTNLVDTPMTRKSDQEFIYYSNKTNQNPKPTIFWVNRKMAPVVYLYPTPSTTSASTNPINGTAAGFGYTMYFTYWITMQDIGALLNNPNVPSRFLEALTSALAAKLYPKLPALKPDVPYDANVSTMLDAKADLAYKQAAKEDVSRVPLTVMPDIYSSGSYGIIR